MLKDLFDVKKEKYGIENELEMLNYLVEHKRLKYIVYGSDCDSVYIIDWIYSVYGLYPDFIVDETPKRSEIMGVNVVSYREFCEYRDAEYFVVVADENYDDPDYKKDVSQKLLANGAIILLNAHRVMKGIWSDWYGYIKDNIDKFQDLYDSLDDDISKDTLYHYLKTYITGKRYEGITFPLEYKYWGKESETDSLFDIKEDEVVLNLGGCCGDTIYLFLKNKFPVKKIISVEADNRNFTFLSRNVGLLEDVDREKIRLDHCFIGEGSNTIDNLYTDENISLIEMDIEGAELAALKTGVGVIKKQRPILAICAYHKKEDLIELPAFIKSILNDYTFALRKYPSELFKELPGIQQINELVLYAIPNERYKKGYHNVTAKDRI